RRRKAYALPLASLYVDLDGAPNFAGRLVPPPSLSVQSSAGRSQDYWYLARPVPPAEGERRNRILAQLAGADPSGWDLTQLLRIPGTVNHKYPEQPAVTVLAHPATMYDPAVLSGP